MADLTLPDIDPAPAEISFNDKWEHYKQDLARLYLDERLALPKIKSIMREKCNLDAEVHQYKYRFDKWGWKKSISSKKKEAILKISEARASQGLDTVVKVQHRPVDVKKLRRFARSRQKSQGLGLFRNTQGDNHQSAFITSRMVGTRIGLLNWDIPFKILHDQASSPLGHPSPFSPGAPTPSDISISGTSNEHAQALACKTKDEKTAMFLTGQFGSLLKVLDQTEKQNLSTWMYQFRQFAFVTAKYWAQGPRFWTASNLWAGEADIAFPGTVQSTGPASVFPLLNISQKAFPAQARRQPLQPSDLCRWAIHVLQDDYEEIPGDPDVVDNNTGNPLDRPWPETWHQPDFSERLVDNLKSNNFSTVPAQSLPVVTRRLARSVETASHEMLEESISFSIISRNTVLLTSLLDKANSVKHNLGHIFPLHLATTYLDGANTCCHIIHHIMDYSNRLQIDPRASNSAGHTVLDSLFLTILRNHSSVSPELADDALRGHHQFPGAELDVCGRWDADVECYRLLVSDESGTIPLTWKHKFCNTSIQAVCHSIRAFGGHMELILDRPSGLFVKQCFICGLKLEMPAVHSLILVAFHLCESGSENEDLFGIICCLFAIVSTGRSSRLFIEVEVSLALLLQSSHEDSCSHRPMDPTNLAQCLTASVKPETGHSAKLGWKLFCSILEHIQLVCEASSRTCQNSACSEYEDDEKCEECPEDPKWDEKASGYVKGCDEHRYISYGEPDQLAAFGNHPVLGHIWACAQTEFLNYRRVSRTDPWTSHLFDMEEMLVALDSCSPRNIHLIATKCLTSYCACGLFRTYPTRAAEQRDRLSAKYLSNMDDWDRTKILDDREIDLEDF